MWFPNRKNHPSSLIEAQERACEIEENLASSFHQVEDCPKEVTQVNLLTNFTTPPPNPPHATKDYLDKERREATRRVVTQVMSVIGKRKTPESRKRTPSVEESLKIEEVMATNKAEKNLLHHIQKILSSPNEQEESHTLEMSQESPSQKMRLKKRLP
jgi:hypothetical protein